jgi:ABC-type spermidine/putrescine transport system permease subunit I
VITRRSILAVPTIVWAGIFFFIPLVLLVFYSFGQINIFTFDVTWGWTFENYQRIIDPLYFKPIMRGVGISLLATTLCLVIGFPVALWMSRLSGIAQSLLLVAVLVPFWASFVVRTYALVNLLSDGGPVADALRAIGIGGGAPGIMYTPLAVAIGIVYSYLPLMILPLFVALERIDPSLLQASADLGASSFRSFRRVTLPLAVPGIVAGCVLVGIPATGEYVIPAILGGGKTLLVGNVIADQFLKVGDYPFGSALAVALVLALLAILVIARSRLRHAEEVA